MPRKKKETPVEQDPPARGAGEAEKWPPIDSTDTPSQYSEDVDNLVITANPDLGPDFERVYDDTEHFEQSFPKYPHLDNLARNDKVLGCKVVQVTEKLDGANVRFGLTPDGDFWAGSRNMILDLTDDTASYGFVGFLKIEKIEQRLRANQAEGYTFYGEWVGPKVQGRITYLKLGFFLFDVREGQDFLPVGAVDAWAGRLGVPQVPRFYLGKPNPDHFNRLRRKPASGNYIEGIVIKAEPPRRDERGDWVMAKHKAPEFEEVAEAKKVAKAAARARREAKDYSAAEAFVDKYVTAERLRHVFQQAREEGIDPLDVRSTGRILALMHADVVREGLPDYQELDKDQQQAVGKKVPAATKPLIALEVFMEREKVA